jgi:hypothetical protein
MRVDKREFAMRAYQLIYAPVEREQELHDGVHDSWLDITWQTSKNSRSIFEPAGKLQLSSSRPWTHAGIVFDFQNNNYPVTIVHGGGEVYFSV